MADSTQRSYSRSIAPYLFVGGIVVGSLGVVSTLLLLRSQPLVCLLLILGGVGAMAMSQLLELLIEIAGHLAAIRAQVGKGVLGLLG